MSKQSKRRRVRAKQEKRAAQVKSQPIPLFTSPIIKPGPSVVTNSGKIRGPTFEFDKQRAFLLAYALLGGITQAAKAAGCNRTSHNKWLREDPAYPALFAEAQEEANDRMEAEARRRAVHGIDRMKFYKGAPILVDGKPYVEHEYSDSLLLALLKAHLPDKYAERVKNEMSGGMTLVDPELQAGLIDLGNMPYEGEILLTEGEKTESISDAENPVDEEPDGSSISP